MAEETQETTAPEPAPEPAAAPPAPATPDAFGTPTAPETPEASPPDVGDALAQLNARFDKIEGRLAPEEPEVPADAWSALTQPAEPEEPVYEPEQAQPQGEGDDPLVKEFYELVDQRVQQIVQPHFQQQELGRRKEAIDGLSTKYPDFAEAIPVIGPKMEQLAQRYGKPELATDPELAESLYQAHKAVAVAATETPAEAAGQGATLETGVGNGNGTEEPSFEQRYLDPIMATVNRGGDAYS